MLAVRRVASTHGCDHSPRTRRGMQPAGHRCGIFSGPRVWPGSSRCRHLSCGLRGVGSAGGRRAIAARGGAVAQSSPATQREPTVEPKALANAARSAAEQQFNDEWLRCTEPICTEVPCATSGSRLREATGYHAGARPYVAHCCTLCPQLWRLPDIFAASICSGIPARNVTLSVSRRDNAISRGDTAA